MPKKAFPLAHDATEDVLEPGAAPDDSGAPQGLYHARYDETKASQGVIQSSMGPGALSRNGPTRTSETEESYLKRADTLLAKCAEELLGDRGRSAEIEPMQIVAWVIERRPALSKSSWRQYKAAVRQWLTHAGTLEAMAARDLLDSKNSSVCLDSTERTSGRRRKSYDHALFHRFLDHIEKGSRDLPLVRYAGLLRTWLMLGRLTGLRPHEWCHSQIVRTPEVMDGLDHHGTPDPEAADFDTLFAAVSELDERATPVQDWADDEDCLYEPIEDGENAGELADGMDARLQPGRVYLKVRNAKHTNGRAHGAYRHLDVTAFGENVMGALERFVGFMGGLERVRYSALYADCKSLLSALNRTFFGEGEKYIQLYSARHFYASSAKKEMRPTEVAAAMGHANDHTAYSMYGNARYGGGGGPMALPLAEEALRVRQVRQVPDFLKQGARETPDAEPET